MAQTITGYIQAAITRNWDGPALTDLHGATYTFADVARTSARMHILFRQAGIQKGDKVAICGKNSARWAMAFLAAFTYGAVPVPLLHEFKPDNLHHLINHSQARLLFTDKQIWANLDAGQMQNLMGAMLLTDFSLLSCQNDALRDAHTRLDELFQSHFPQFTAADVAYEEHDPDDLAVINYTSGSMGFSKGVMIPYRALTSNMTYAIEHLTFLLQGDGMICMLPLAHMFGLSIEMLHPFVKGCHLHFLGSVPSPKILMDAFARVKPKLIITVPLVVEKIIRGKVFPELQKPLMRFLLRLPIVRGRVYATVAAKLSQVFGGSMRQLIVGGAALNKDVDDFLRRIHFPITVGYGMTECAPLISYAPWDENESGACGRIVDRMQMRIQSPDPRTTPGELWVKGDNVMLGYYNNEGATAAVMQDGWMNTGDLCQLDASGLIYIRGRSKNMILGANGQNIYPEEIEMRVNNLPHVTESLVIDDHGKLTVLIFPDQDSAAQQGIPPQQIEELMKQQIAALNRDLPAYCQLKSVRIQSQEFEKTPKRSIKRFLYEP